MKILVLGATGQIGYALVTALARTEHQVSALVRRSAAPALPDTVRVMQSPHFTGDVLAAAMADVDHVIYSLGPPEQFLFQESAFEAVHCELLSTFLDAMRGSAVRRLTYISTYEVFQAVDGVISEHHPIAKPEGMTPYSRAKLRGFRMVEAFARNNNVQITSIHPAAVYGGRNTGDGMTDFLANLIGRKWYRVPFVNDGTFPVIHVESLAELIINSLDRPGAYLASDEMTTLPKLARLIRAQTASYVPLTMPLPIVKLGVAFMEALAPVVRIKPLIASGQIDFLTRGLRPDAAKAMRDLAWSPMPLNEGIRRVLASVPSHKPAPIATGAKQPRAA